MKPTKAKTKPAAKAKPKAVAKAKPAANTKQTLVYVGPTLPADEVRALLPDATILPPASVGDILKAAHRTDVARIALIDGYFERMAAVWHKEILVAMERGIEVWGAASMGALRAAELAPFGMRGVGVIFAWYRTGYITADDEVAVAHLPAEFGYRTTSDALVNIRYTLAAFPVRDAKRAKALLAQAQATFYRERAWDKLAPGVPLIDRKADDARMLLSKLRKTRKPSARRKIRVPRTWALRQLELLML